MKISLLSLLVFLLPTTLHGYCYDGTLSIPPSNLFVVQSWDALIEGNAPVGLPRPAADILKDREHHASEWAELDEPKELKLKPVSMSSNVNRLGVRYELVFALSGPYESPWIFRGVPITNYSCKVRLETSTGTVIQSQTVTLDASHSSVTAVTSGTFPIDPVSELYKENKAFVRLYNGDGSLLASHQITWECKCDDCGAATGASKSDIGSVEYNIPITSIRNGRTPVAFEYRSELLANQGRSGLVFNGPQGTTTSGAVTVLRNGSNQIDSVTVGNLIAVVTAAPIAGDAQRFIVTVSTDKANPSSTVFRTVVYENATVSGNPAFKITETLFGKTTEAVYQKPSSTPAATTWEMTTGNGLRRVTEITDTSVAGRETKRRTIQERKDDTQTFQAVSDVTITRKKFSWGWETILEVVDPDGQALATSWDFYDGGANTAPPGGSSTLGNGSVKSMNGYDGRAELHYYYAPASLVTYQSVHETRGAFAGTGDSRKVVENEGLNTNTNVQVFLTETFIGTTQVGKATIQRDITSGVTISRDYSNATAYLETQTTETALGASRSQVFPNGTRSIFTENPSGTLLKHFDQKGVFAGSTQIAGDYNVETLNEEGYVIIINNGELASATAGSQTHLARATTVDPFGRPLVMTHFPNGAAYAYTTETEYACCGLARERDKLGIDTYYAYDSLRRRVKTHRLGVTTETVHAGRTTSIHRYPETVNGTFFSFSSATSGNEISRSVRNLAGDVIETWARTAADGSLVKTNISTAYAPAAGLSRRITTQPPSTPDDGTAIPTRVEEFYLDGQPFQQTGNLAPAMRHAYAVTATGVSTVTSYLDGAALRETTTTQADWLGREVSKTYSSDENADSVNDFSQSIYNTLGQLSHTVDPDGVVTLYGYNPLGQQTTVATDLNGNLAIDLAVDRVSFSQTAATRDNVHGTSITVSRTTQSARIDDGPGNPIELVTLREDSTYDGLRRWSSRFPGRLGSPTLQSGAETVSITTLAGPGDWTVRTTAPDSTYTVAIYLGGRLDTFTYYDRDNALLYTLGYAYDDPLLRLTSTTDSRTGTTTFHYVNDTTDVIQSVTDSINRITSYTYDARNRKLTTNLPDSLDANGTTLSNITTTHYFPNGSVQETLGDQTYRSTYTYDYAQRLSTLTTYGTQSAITRWEYDIARGLLRAKRHNSPAPGSGFGPTYSYTAAGRMKSRTWARLVSGQPLTTTYGYHPATGDLASTNYSDTTPSVSISARDRLGRITALTDAAGSHSYSHKLTGPMLTDAVTGVGPLAGFTLTHSPDSLDRPSGTALTKSGSAVHASLYGYDPAGRPSTLSHAGRSATYAYHPIRQKLAVTSLIGTSGQTNLIHEQVHDNAGRLLHTVSHATPTGQSTLTPAHLSKYTLNSLDQRTAAAELGDRSWSYGYNAAGEVIRAAKTLTSTGASLEGRNYRYNFDGIGNRTSIQTGGDSTATNLRTATYTPDALNQYTAITQPGFLEIYGKAPVAQAVTVNALATTRQGRDFRKELNFPNTNQRWESITTNGGSVSTSQHHLPAASTTPTYDLDGNLTADGQWIFTWDAENRLTSATRSPAATSAGAPYRLITYRYDSQSRQFSRSVVTTPGGTPTGTLYLYDGWNVIAEYAGTTLAKTYLWGLDLSGTPQGAGGVGGLLSISDIATATTHYPCYDGNGNVRKLLNATTLVTTATYDYGPFGELVRATGPYALSNPYRFSTKPQDAGTRLYYYGYRYYDPLTGRWPSMDPIGEKGGVNLYGMVGNNGVNRWDLLGLTDFWNSHANGAHTGQRDGDVQEQIEALRQLELITGEGDGKPCFKVTVFRNATTGDMLQAAGQGDISIITGHGGKSNDGEGRIIEGSDGRIDTADIGKRADKELNKCTIYGCYIYPNFETTSPANFSMQLMTNEIIRLGNPRPKCCRTVKQVMIALGPDNNSYTGAERGRPTYPPGSEWIPK